jgi:6-pyruvoyltetrahydropterin/6-carboxytetrahydropterin synthase
MFLVTKEFRFESAHFLPKYYGKCENLHGHSYRLQVTVKIPKLNDDGLAYDFVNSKKSSPKKW